MSLLRAQRATVQVGAAVAGRGSTGIAAALAAAAAGLRLDLIETYGFFGGAATVAGVQRVSIVIDARIKAHGAQGWRA